MKATTIGLAMAALFGSLAAAAVAQQPAQPQPPKSDFFDTKEQTLAKDTDKQKELRQAVQKLDGYVVFAQSSDKKNTSELFRLDLAAFEVKQLTKLGGRSGEPRISPDGTKVIFSYSPAKDAKEAAPGDIRIVDIDGATEPKVVATGCGGAPSWSPDAKAVVTAKYSREKDAHVWIVDLATGDKTDITPPNTRNNFQPYWSRDGKTIITTWQSRGNWTLAAIHVDPATKKVVGQWAFPVRYDGCNWELSPAGDNVAWVRDHGGDTYSSIWTAPFDIAKQNRGAVLNLGVGPYNRDNTWNYFPTFSPDGQYILLARCPGYREAKALGWTVNKYEGEKMDLFVAPAGGGVMARLTWGLDNVTHPDWHAKPAAAKAAAKADAGK